MCRSILLGLNYSKVSEQKPVCAAWRSKGWYAGKLGSVGGDAGGGQGRSPEFPRNRQTLLCPEKTQLLDFNAFKRALVAWTSLPPHSYVRDTAASQDTAEVASCWRELAAVLIPGNCRQLVDWEASGTIFVAYFSHNMRHCAREPLMPGRMKNPGGMRCEWRRGDIAPPSFTLKKHFCVFLRSSGKGRRHADD